MDISTKDKNIGLKNVQWNFKYPNYTRSEVSHCGDQHHTKHQTRFVIYGTKTQDCLLQHSDKMLFTLYIIKNIRVTVEIHLVSFTHSQLFHDIIIAKQVDYTNHFTNSISM